MSKKIVLFILFFLSFLLIFLGVIFYLENINNGKNYSSSDSDSLELSGDEIKDIYEKECPQTSSRNKHILVFAFKDTCMVIALYICSQLQIYKAIKEEYRVGGKWCI
jgi:hypothetical protein